MRFEEETEDEEGGHEEDCEDIECELLQEPEGDNENEEYEEQYENMEEEDGESDLEIVNGVPTYTQSYINKVMNHSFRSNDK